MKKLFAMVLAIAMIATMMVMPVMAAETYTLTINNDVAGHTYEAYQIFSGDLTEQDGKQILTNIKWGSSVSDGAALLVEFNTTYNLTAADAAAMAEWIANNVTSDSVTLDAIAVLFGKYLGTPAGTSNDAQGNSTYEDGQYTISGLNSGYYLVKDKDDTLDNKYDAYTKFILRVVKDQEVTPKSDVPEVDKTINDTLNGTFGEHEDFDIADTAYYKWAGTLPSNLSDFDTYYYKFTDTLPVGISFKEIEQVYIEGHDGNVVHTFYDKTAATNEVTLENDNDSVTLTHTPGEFVRDDDTNAITSVTSQEQIVLEFNDLLKLYPSLLSTHKIVVKYTALVNRDAVFATAMENEVTLIYNNDPNGDGKGQTTPDEAYAFTFEIKVDKYDADDSDKKLEGAEFVLYYQRIEQVEGVDTTVKYYAQVVTEEMLYKTDDEGNLTTELRDDRMVISGKAIELANLGNVYSWTKVKSDASILDTDVNGFLRVGGLDSGIYYLEETVPPAGYNLMETPVQINIKPVYSANGDEVTVTYAVDSIDQTSNTVGVRNSAGSTLPVTGGVGTTLFYVFGGLMVAAAVVLLVTKKRMAA